MKSYSKMVSYRADWPEYEWLHSFNLGNISQSLHTILRVCRLCLSRETFNKWRWMSEQELKGKHLELVDNGTGVCNTEPQG